MVSNFGGSAALLHALGLFIGYSIWWTYFDNMNLAVLDNSHHHLMVVWAHLNLCMYVCVYSGFGNKNSFVRVLVTGARGRERENT